MTTACLPANVSAVRLTLYTRHAIRVLVHLAATSDRLSTISEIAQAYGLSHNHLMKVVHDLRRAGFVESVRGRTGGIRLARPRGRSRSVTSCDTRKRSGHCSLTALE